eukprot:345151-Chlamydomonas_euryale.AAC.1
MASFSTPFELQPQCVCTLPLPYMHTCEPTPDGAAMPAQARSAVQTAAARLQRTAYPTPACGFLEARSSTAQSPSSSWRRGRSRRGMRCMAVARRLHGYCIVVAWQSHGGCRVVARRLHYGCMAVAQRRGDALGGMVGVSDARTKHNCA